MVSFLLRFIWTQTSQGFAKLAELNFKPETHDKHLVHFNKYY